MGTPRLGDAQRLGNSGNVRTDKIQSAIIFVDPATSLDILFDVHVDDIVPIPTSHFIVRLNRGSDGDAFITFVVLSERVICLCFMWLQSPRNFIIKRTFSEASRHNDAHDPLPTQWPLRKLVRVRKRAGAAMLTRPTRLTRAKPSPASPTTWSSLTSELSISKIPPISHGSQR